MLAYLVNGVYRKVVFQPPEKKAESVESDTKRMGFKELLETLDSIHNANKEEV